MVLSLPTMAYFKQYDQSDFSESPMRLILLFLLHTIQMILVPLCFLLAWVFILILAWTLWSSVQEVIHRTHKMHQIPCANCQFFTNNHRLKCTLQPTIANTEQAINCSDYTTKGNLLI